MRRFVLLLIFVSSLAGPMSARAETTTQKPVQNWYGWQIIPLDVLSLTLLSAGAVIWANNEDSGGDQLMLIGAAAFVLGAPIVHGLHGEPMPALGSFVLRLFAPPLAGMLVAMIGAPLSCVEDVCSGAFLIPATLAFGTSMLASSVLDIIFLATETVEAPRIVPTISVTRSQTTLGVAFAF